MTERHDGKTEPRRALSKPMQDAMLGRGYYELNTARALEKRGLARVRVTRAYGGTTVHLDPTDAGRAWIAEQIEAAHVEALALNAVAAAS